MVFHFITKKLYRFFFFIAYKYIILTLHVFRWTDVTFTETMRYFLLPRHDFENIRKVMVYQQHTNNIFNSYIFILREHFFMIM